MRTVILATLRQSIKLSMKRRQSQVQKRGSSTVRVNNIISNHGISSEERFWLERGVFLGMQPSGVKDIISSSTK
jgi:hypothetical protein